MQNSERDFLRELVRDLAEETQTFIKKYEMSRNGHKVVIPYVETEAGAPRKDVSLTLLDFTKSIHAEAKNLAETLGIKTHFTENGCPYEVVITLAASAHGRDTLQMPDGSRTPAQFVVWVFHIKNQTEPVRLYKLASESSDIQYKFASLTSQAMEAVVAGMHLGKLEIPLTELVQDLNFYMVHGNQDEGTRLEEGGGRGPASNTLMHSTAALINHKEQNRFEKAVPSDEALKFVSPVDAVFMRHIGNSLQTLMTRAVPEAYRAVTQVNQEIVNDERIFVVRFTTPQTKQVADLVTIPIVAAVQELHTSAVHFFEQYYTQRLNRVANTATFITELIQNHSFTQEEAEWLANFVSIVQPDAIQLENWAKKPGVSKEDREQLNRQLERNKRREEQFRYTTETAPAAKAKLAKRIKKVLGGASDLGSFIITSLFTDRLIPGDSTDPDARKKALRDARTVYLPKEATFVLFNYPCLQDGHVLLNGVGFGLRLFTHKSGAEQIQGAIIGRQQLL